MPLSFAGSYQNFGVTSSYSETACFFAKAGGGSPGLGDFTVRGGKN
jgi:hypothetical protein